MVNRKSNKLIGFENWMIDNRHFENLSEKTSQVDPKNNNIDRYVSYNLIDLVKIL